MTFKDSTLKYNITNISFEKSNIIPDNLHSIYGFKPHKFSTLLYSPQIDIKYSPPPLFSLYYQISKMNKDIKNQFPLLELFKSIFESQQFMASWSLIDQGVYRSYIKDANYGYKYDSNNANHISTNGHNYYWVTTDMCEFNYSEMINNYGKRDNRYDKNSIQNCAQLLLNWNYARPSISKETRSLMYVDIFNNIEQETTNKINITTPTGTSTMTAEYSSIFLKKCESLGFVINRNIQFEPLKDGCFSWKNKKGMDGLCPGTTFKICTEWVEPTNSKYHTDGNRDGDYANGVYWKVSPKEGKYMVWSPIVNKLYFARNWLSGCASVDQVTQACAVREGQPPECQYQQWFSDYNMLNKVDKPIKNSINDNMIVLSPTFGTRTNCHPSGFSRCDAWNFDVYGAEASTATFNAPIKLKYNDRDMFDYLNKYSHIYDQNIYKYFDNKNYSCDFFKTRFTFYKSLISKQVSIFMNNPTSENLLNIFTYDNKVKDYVIYSGLLPGFLDICANKLRSKNNSIKGIARCLATSASNKLEYNPTLDYLHEEDNKTTIMKNVLSKFKIEDLSLIFLDKNINNFSSYLSKDINEISINNQHLLEVSKYYGSLSDLLWHKTPLSLLTDNCSLLDGMPEYTEQNEIAFGDYLLESQFFCRSLNYHPAFYYDSQSFFGYSLPYVLDPINENNKKYVGIGLFIDNTFYQFSGINNQSLQTMINVLKINDVLEYFKSEVNTFLNHPDVIYLYKMMLYMNYNFYKLYDIKNIKTLNYNYIEQSSPIISCYFQGKYIDCPQPILSDVQYIKKSNNSLYYTIQKQNINNSNLKNYLSSLSTSFDYNQTKMIELPTTFQQARNILLHASEAQAKITNINLTSTEGKFVFRGKYYLDEDSIKENTIIIGGSCIPSMINWNASIKKFSLTECTTNEFLPIPAPAFKYTKCPYNRLNKRPKFSWSLKSGDPFKSITGLLNDDNDLYYLYIAEIDLSGESFSIIDTYNISKNNNISIDLLTNDTGALELKFKIKLNMELVTYNFTVWDNLI